MSEAIKPQQKKELAKLYYLTGQYTQKDIAVKVGVRESTISNWVTKEKWDLLKKSMLTSKSESLRTLYDVLASLDKKIKASVDAIGDTKLADMYIKYTAAIKNLETETSIAQIVEVGRLYINWLLVVDPAQAQITVNNMDAFIKEKLKAY